VDENKRPGNEQEIKKGKVLVHVTLRVRPEGVAGFRRPVCSITIVASTPYIIFNAHFWHILQTTQRHQILWNLLVEL
jgi:hypothetical protein